MNLKCQWEPTPLSKFIQFKNGKKRPERTGKIPVYGGNGILDYTNIANQQNGIIIGRVGAYCGSVFYEPNQHWVSDNAISAVNKDNSDIVFDYYLLKSLNLNHRHIGTSQPLLTQEILNSIEISFPPLIEQIEIGRILRTLDNKIAANIKINHHLEQTARAIFKAWFVDNASDSWKDVSLGAITHEIRTKVKEQKLQVLSAVKTGNLVLSEDYFTKQVYSKDIGKYIIVEPNDFAYNPARINIGSIGINSFDFVGCVSPVYVVFRAEPEYHHFLSFFLKSPNFQEEVRVRASGSVRQSLNYEDFALIQVIYPPIDLVRKFNYQYDGILELIRQIDLENNLLTEIRDSLLPRLMSGDLSVTDLGGAK